MSIEWGTPTNVRFKWIGSNSGCLHIISQVQKFKRVSTFTKLQTFLNSVRPNSGLSRPQKGVDWTSGQSEELEDVSYSSATAYVTYICVCIYILIYYTNICIRIIISHYIMYRFDFPIFCPACFPHSLSSHPAALQQ